MLDRISVETWTDDRITQLTALLADGLSSSQIANEMGCFNHCDDGGRSAVIGKIHRLGLVRPIKKMRRHLPGNSGLSREEKARRQRDRHILKMLKLGTPEHGGPRMVEIKIPEPAPDLQQFNDAIPTEQRCGLLELTAEKCHFPVGNPSEPGFFFCASETEGATYCSFHAGICFAPAVRRDRRPVQA